MAITINGTGSITGLTAGGLPDASITSDDIAAGAVTAAKLAAGAGGKILQVVSSTKTSATQYSTGTSWTDLGVSVNITPSATSSKILVIWQIRATSNDRSYIILVRSGTQLAYGDAASSRIQATADSFYNDGDGFRTKGASGSYLDSPSTTSSQTYRIDGRCSSGGGIIIVNRSYTDTDSSLYGRTTSTITVMEVAA